MRKIDGVHLIRAGKILVEVKGETVEVAVLEHGMLVEFFKESLDGFSRVGQIFRGEVVSIVNSLNSAFVRIPGMDQMGFLHVSEVPHGDVVSRHVESLTGGSLRRDGESSYPPIASIVKVGQSIDVQILKDPVGKKGAKLTGFLSVAGRYLVRMEGVSQVLISKRIQDHSERERLTGIVSRFLSGNHGYIVRTNAEHVKAGDLEDDAQHLEAVWQVLSEKRLELNNRASESNTDQCFAQLYAEEGVFQRVLRDVYQPNRMDIEAAGEGERFKELLKDAENRHLSVRVHSDLAPSALFSLYKVHEQISSALKRMVRMPSGATIVIDIVEAMTVIDVNTGKNVNNGSSMDTILRTNLEAAREIARQIRLRNIGGVIVVDFIDMEFREDRQKVLEALEAALKFDRFQTQIYPFTELGLVQITRKRSSHSLKQQFARPCTDCGATGYRIIDGLFNL